MVIEVENLIKDFRDHFWTPQKRILKGVSFSVAKGSIYGFLGPNGAGKTTTIKVLMGLLFPTSGTARVLGYNISDKEYKRKIGYLPESPYFYDYLDASEFIRFYAQLFGMNKKESTQKVHDLLEEVGLKESKKVQLRKFSKGMLQRIGLAQAMVNDPELLILDEPMTGLDPMGRKKIRDIILRCRDAGKTIFFSSHILGDVEMICDQVSIIVDGKIVDSGYIKDLLNPKVLVYEIQIDREDKKNLGGGLLGEGKYIERGKSIFIKAADEKQLRDINSALIDKGVRILSITPVKETLEDIFVKKVDTQY